MGEGGNCHPCPPFTYAPVNYHVNMKLGKIPDKIINVQHAFLAPESSVNFKFTWQVPINAGCPNILNPHFSMNSLYMQQRNLFSDCSPVERWYNFYAFKKPENRTLSSCHWSFTLFRTAAWNSLSRNGSLGTLGPMEWTKSVWKCDFLAFFGIIWPEFLWQENQNKLLRKCQEMTSPCSYEGKWHETFVKSNVNHQILKFSDQWLK